MSNKQNNSEESGDNEEYRTQILELCKLAQGNITTIYWCKQQIRKRLKVLDRLVLKFNSIDDSKKDTVSENDKNRISEIIKKQTEFCKNLGVKIQDEIESLEQIRIAAKTYGVDIKTKLKELRNSSPKNLDSDIDSLFKDE